MNLRILTTLLLIMAWIHVPAFSQPDDLGSPRALTLYFENDVFSGTDRCYTGGYQLAGISKALADTRKKSLDKMDALHAWSRLSNRLVLRSRPEYIHPR